MADPTTIGLIAKAAISALSDERLRKGIGWTIAAILSPFILIIVIICGLLSGTAIITILQPDCPFMEVLYQEIFLRISRSDRRYA